MRGRRTWGADGTALRWARVAEWAPLLVCASVLGSVSLLGCAAATHEDEPAPSLEIGTGTWRFEPLDDGAVVPLVKGAQGGWHVWLSVRVDGLDASRGSLAIELQPADESEPAETTTVGVSLDPPDAEGRRSYLGWPAILSDPSCAVGELLRVRATLTTSAGERLVAERELMPSGGDDPPPACPR